MLAPCPAKEHVIAASDLAKKRFAGAAEQLNSAENARAAAQREVQTRDAADRQRTSRTAAYNALVSRVRELKVKIDSPECIAAREQAEACNVARVDSMGRSGAMHQVRLELRAARDAYAVAKSARDRAEYDIASQGAVLKRIEEREVAKKAARSEMRAAELVVRAFGPTGIPARIAAQQLIALEERANALLSGTGLSFTLGWERETRDAAPICYECGYSFKGKKEKTCPSCDATRGFKRSEELEILVDAESGEAEDVRTASGGAKVLVASAIRLAGGLMLRELRGCRVAWTLVDEPFGALDAENREQLARTFAGMLGSVGLEQAFVVSHDAALLDALPCKIQITRDGSKSCISLER
jgi:rubrerythrin